MPETRPEPVLRLRNVDSGYGNLKVLRHVSLHVDRGEIVCIIGANGAGKTTLLRSIVGLLRAQAGEIHFDGRDITAARTEAIARDGCSLVPEGRQVFAPMTVRENLLLGATARLAGAAGRGPRSGGRGLAAGLRAVSPARGKGQAARRYAVGGRAADAGRWAAP